MCTQEIIWCSCGHGELLPIVMCAHAEAAGKCWTVVHGDHRIVLQMKCSYCVSGPTVGAGEEGDDYCRINSTRPALSTKARPEGELAKKIEMMERERLGGGGMAFSAGELPLEVEDVVGVHWNDAVNLDPDLWQYF